MASVGSRPEAEIRHVERAAIWRTVPLHNPPDGLREQLGL